MDKTEKKERLLETIMHLAGKIFVITRHSYGYSCDTFTITTRRVV